MPIVQVSPSVSSLSTDFSYKVSLVFTSINLFLTGLENFYDYLFLIMPKRMSKSKYCEG